MNKCAKIIEGYQQCEAIRWNITLLPFCVIKQNLAMLRKRDIMDKKCVVSSLSEYIAAIEKYNLFNCISRGESELYEKPMSSGVQRNKLKGYTKLLEQYHLDVETSINKIQDKNFLAFAQHHGIPTNLLDFSFSPLVSLYFSIDGCTDKGYVYFINKNKMVNINKVLYKKPLGWGMLDELLNYDLDLYVDIMPQMSDAFIANRKEMIKYFENHADEFISKFRKTRSPGYLASIEGGVDDFEKALIQYREDKPKWEADERVHEEVTLQIYSSVPNFLRSMQKIYKGDISYPKKFFENYSKVSDTKIMGTDYAANIDVLMFLHKMEEIEYFYNQVFSTDKLDYELELPFYFTYQPPIIDERVKNQSSIFIFQTFNPNVCYYEGKPIRVWQKIMSDFVIEIDNPEKIGEELDAIGFNQKHIYCDYDSIAKYLVSHS